MAATNDLYSYCTAQLGDAASADEKLQCFSSQLSSIMSLSASNTTTTAAASQSAETTTSSSAITPELIWFARDFLLLYAAAMVFLMQAGFAMVCAGCVRKKNVGNTMLKNLLDACGSSIAFYCVGYAFAFGGHGDGVSKSFIGSSNFFLIDVDDYAFWIFQYTFSAASATVVAGALAERCQMGAYLAYSLFLCGFVYPVIARAVWSPQGFLSGFAEEPLFGVGMIDFAGSGVVHFTGGTTALFATQQLGPRRGRFHDPVTMEKWETPQDFPGHSIALQMLGTFILWFGWFGFNTGPALLLDSVEHAGQVASLAGVNTALSGGMGGIMALLANVFYMHRTTGEPVFDLKYAMNGSLTGLAAITAGCGVVEAWSAIVIGMGAGLIYLVASRTLVWRMIDDAVDAIPVHMCGGIWGIFAVGCFASPRRLELVYGHGDHPGWFYAVTQGSAGADGTLMAAQLVGLVFIFGWCLCIMFPFFIFLNVMGWFRSDPLEEIVGLDRSYHGGVYLLRKDQQDSEGEPDSESLSAFEEQKKMKRSRHSIRNSHHGDNNIDNNGAPQTTLEDEEERHETTPKTSDIKSDYVCHKKENGTNESNDDDENEGEGL